MFNENRLQSTMLKDSITDKYWFYLFMYFQEIQQITYRAILSGNDEIRQIVRTYLINF